MSFNLCSDARLASREQARQGIGPLEEPYWTKKQKTKMPGVAKKLKAQYELYGEGNTCCMYL